MQSLFNRAHLHLRLSLMLAGIMLLSVLGLGVFTLGAFDRKIAPELVNRTHLIGAIVRGEVQHTLELGVPLEAMTGLERYLHETLKRFPEVDRIAVQTNTGKVVAEARRETESGSAWFGQAGVDVSPSSAFSLSVLDGNEVVGEIAVATNPRQVQTRLRSVFLDVLAIALVAVLVAVELVLALIAYSVSEPMARIERLLDAQETRDFRDRVRPVGLGSLKRVVDRLNDHAVDLASRLLAASGEIRARVLAQGARIAEGTPGKIRLASVADIRLVLFMFAVASEIASAFLPVYAGDAARPQWLSREVAAALPLLCYLVVIGIFSPLAERQCQRLGARRLFMLSVVPTGLALVGMATSDSVLAISLWRGVLAIAYAAATIACQVYALRAGGSRDSLGGIGAFLAVIYAGVFCGATLGGVLAGRFGYAAAFLTGASIAVFSLMLGHLMMRGEAGDAFDGERAARPVSRLRHGLRIGQLVLVLGIAVPLNVTTAVFIWYLTPLALNAAGAGPAEVARVVMLYYLTTVLVTPLVTRLARSGLSLRMLVFVGAAGSGLALMLPGWIERPWVIVACVALLGATHALMRAPMTSLALAEAQAAGGTLTPLRVFERVGAIVGLAVSALTLDPAAGASALPALALVVIVGLMGYLLIDFTGMRRSKREGLI